MKGLQEKERKCILLIKRKKCEQVSTKWPHINASLDVLSVIRGWYITTRGLKEELRY